MRTHSGRYTITAKNKAGQKHVNVRVNVLGKCSIKAINDGKDGYLQSQEKYKKEAHIKKYIVF